MCEIYILKMQNAAERKERQLKRSPRAHAAPAGVGMTELSVFPKLTYRFKTLLDKT